MRLVSANENKERVRRDLPLICWMIEKDATWDCISQVLAMKRLPHQYQTSTFASVCRELLSEADPSSTLDDAAALAELRSIGLPGSDWRFSGHKNSTIRNLIKSHEQFLLARDKSAYAALAERDALLATIADLQGKLDAALRRADAKTAENTALWTLSQEQQARNQALRGEIHRLEGRR